MGLSLWLFPVAFSFNLTSSEQLRLAHEEEQQLADVHSLHIYLVKAVLATLITGLSGAGLLIGVKLVQESKTRSFKQKTTRLGSKQK